MKRVLIGILVTLVLLAVARYLSTNRPQEIRIERAGLSILHSTVFEQVGPGEPTVHITIEPTGGAEPYLIVKETNNGDTGEIPMAHAGGGVWEGQLPARDRGERLHYAFRIAVPDGDPIRLPDKADSSFLVKYKGEISSTVLLLHVIFMFGSFFFMVQGFWGAVRILKGRDGKAGTVTLVRWVMLTTFVGGWPLGFILNYQRFGTVWEGFPFGYDITDNKTQLIFLFWIVTMLLVRGSFFGRGEVRDVVGSRGFAWAVIVSFVMSLALFMIPHSL